MKQEELKKLLDTMSLQEKIDQMLQLTGDFYQDADSVLTGPAVQLGVTGEDVHMAGSILGTCRAEKLIKIQKRYMENHPHHIPLLFMMDIIHGMKTIFPIPLGQGASFEPELSKRCVAAAAKEAAVSGLHVTFAPMVDLVRDARWGRVMESTGEDTWLNSLFARAMVEGFQGDDLKEPYKVAACVKHFAAYGAPQAGREYHTVELSENTLREYYLPAYQAGIDAKAAMVMTSFNTVNGIPASTNRWLMRDILREEMGFDGVLISDFSAILETIAHGCSEDSREAAVKALEAGVDIDMSKRKFVDVQVIFHKMEQRTLSAAYKFYCEKNLEDAHTAEADTRATYEVLKAQLDRYPDLQNDIAFLADYSSFSKNVDFAGRMVYDDNGTEVFNFGKYKGMSVAEVLKKDPGYYSWILNSDFTLNTKAALTKIRLREMSNLIAK